MACRRCGREHQPVTLAEWSWMVRDLAAKPAAAHLAVLWFFATRLDGSTGCGFASNKDLAQLTGLSHDTVQRAMKWALEHGIVHRAIRGHRLGDGTKTSSEWHLLLPPQPRTGAALSAASTTQTGGLKHARVRPQESPLQESHSCPGVTPLRRENLGS